MPTIFFHPDGSASPNPTSQKAAKKHRKARYDDLQVCPKCEQRHEIEHGHRCSIKYTRSDRCIHCATLDAIYFFNLMVLSDKPAPLLSEPTDEMRQAFELFPDGCGDEKRAPISAQEAAEMGSPVWVRPDPCPAAGHIGVRTIEGDCWFCEQKTTATRNAPRIEAREAGQAWYTPTEACPDCGQHAPRNTRTNQCRSCHPLATDMPSPRQQALDAGETWYTPTTPCPKCGTLAQRRVNNGACQGCQPTKGATLSMGRCPPGTYLARADAQLLGFTTYNTGKPCKHGHTAERYTSTGGCVECLKKDRAGS